MIKEFYCPETILEAAQLKKKYGANVLFLAGGTEINSRKDIRAENVISLAKLRLDEIKLEGNIVKIGAMVTLQTILESELLTEWNLEGLRKAARNMANMHIRNMATLGGNIGVNRSSSDMIPILLVYGAKLEVFCPEKLEPLTLSVEEYIQAQQRGLIVNVLIPMPAKDFRFSIAKHSRTHNDIASMNVAVGLTTNDGKICDPTIAVGGVSSHAIRLSDVEALLKGMSSQNFERNSVEKKVQESVSPISDIRGTAQFKRHLAAVLIADAVEECLKKEE